MSTPTRAIALLALLVAPLLAAGCSDGPAPPMSEGALLFRRQSCDTCHKLDGHGGPFGPSLMRTPDYWDREALADFLGDPAAAVKKDARLRSIAENFRQAMPPVGLSREERLKIADHVLELAAGQSSQ